MKIKHLHIALGFICLLSSCTSKCPCSSDELSLFKHELENHHLRVIDKNDITCKKVDEFWRVSWDPINKQVPVNWDLLLDTDEMEPADAIVDLGIKERQLSKIKPLIRKARSNGYDFASISSKGWNKITVLVLGENKGFLVSQQYKIENNDWTLSKTTKSWAPEGDSLDLTKLP